ncbi:uncharacterized protein LOC135698448 [Ochlerotatus camptorhynchus]|uniref:uncharacterized protein LOC135698448 n=1 Tax=Ochlerotatus camptorhynchus TaxID=644619 RepID=UPI0031D17B3F
MQYGRKCLVCKNTRQREPSCRLFKFPARGCPMWYRWLEACGLREFDIDASSREPPRLCQRHFQKKDFLTRQLTGTAVPSVFPVTVYTEIDGGNSSVRKSVVGLQQQQQQVIGDVYQIDEVTMQQEEIFNDVIEYSESIPDGSIDGSVDNDGQLATIVLTEDPAQLKLETDLQPLVIDCNVEEHTRLSEDLLNERGKVELLARELLEKDRIIREQYELLKQLGVHLVTFTEVQQ